MLPSSPFGYYKQKNRLKKILVTSGIFIVVFVVGGVFALNTQLGLFRGDARSLADEHGCDAKNSEIWCGNCNSCKKAWDGCNCGGGGGSTGGGATSGGSGGGGCKGASNCKTTCSDGAHFEDTCPAGGAFGTCDQWSKEACAGHGGGGGSSSGGTTGGTTGGGSTRGIANGRDSGCCGSDGECVGWFGAGSTCSNSNGACASGKQCKGGATAAACGESCKAGDCGRVICQGTSAQQTCNSGCKPVCGNGVCENTETYANCPADCNPSVGGANIPTGGSYCSSGVVNGKTVSIEGVCNLTKMTCNQWFAEKAKNPNVDCGAGLTTGTGSACSSSSESRCSGKKVGEICGTDPGYFCDGIYSTGSGYWCTCRGTTISTTAPAGTKCAGGSEAGCSASSVGASCNYNLYHPGENYTGPTQCKQTGGTATAPSCACRADTWSASGTPAPTPICQTKSKCESSSGTSCSPDPTSPNCYIPTSDIKASNSNGGGSCGSSCSWYLANQCASGLSCTGNGVCRNDKCLEKSNCVCDPTPTADRVPTPNLSPTAATPTPTRPICPTQPKCVAPMTLYMTHRSQGDWDCTTYTCVAPSPTAIAAATPKICQTVATCRTNQISVSQINPTTKCPEVICTDKAVPTGGANPTTLVCPTIPSCPSGQESVVTGKNDFTGCAIMKCQAVQSVCPPGPICTKPQIAVVTGKNDVTGCGIAECKDPSFLPTPAPECVNGESIGGPSGSQNCVNGHWGPVIPAAPTSNPVITTTPKVTNTPTPIPSVTQAPQSTPSYGGASSQGSKSGFSGSTTPTPTVTSKPNKTVTPAKTAVPSIGSATPPSR